MNKSIYIIIANEEERVKECIILSELEKAQEVFNYLKTVWGKDNVYLASRAIDDIPFVIEEQLNR